MTPARIRQRLARVVEPAMERLAIPGVSIGLLVDGRPFGFGFGVTSAEHPRPVDEETVFLIGSTTKTYTGTAVMCLVDEGTIDLEAPVRRYLPKLRLAGDVDEHVTMRHLLTHTGGWVGDYFDDLGRGEDALRRIVARLARKAPQLTPLGQVWAYNNSGFYVAGRVLEVLERAPYETVIERRILRPLGMTRSTFFPEQAMTFNHAVGHLRTKNGPRVMRPWGMPRTAHAAGGIASTAMDQMRYAAFHLGDGRAPDGARVLRRPALRTMQKPLIAGGLSDRMGLSWMIDSFDGVKVCKHGGSINGQMSEFVFVPSRGFAISVLTNGSAGHELGRLAVLWALDKLAGVRRTVPPARRMSAAALGAYAGSYRLRTGGRIVIEPNGTGLELKVEHDRKTIEANPDVTPPEPRELVFTARDRAVLADGTGLSRADFLRGDDGRVAWIRVSGRIFPKV